MLLIYFVHEQRAEVFGITISHILVLINIYYKLQFSFYAYFDIFCKLCNYFSGCDQRLTYTTLPAVSKLCLWCAVSL